jgi:ligand-binding SRPBCC domain-containing protein
MKIFEYQTELLLPISIDEAWKFFSSAKNLSLITPPEMSFKILTSLDGSEIYEGMLIDYQVKPLFGIPLKWQTQIIKVNKPFYFTDLQLKGPYSIWEHTHTFTETKNGVFMHDLVRYQLPLGFLGLIAHQAIVKKKIEDIFDYRKTVLNKIFNKDGINNN